MRLGGLAAMGDFWRVVREFNPEGIEREATAPVDITVVGFPESGRHTLVQGLMTERAEPGDMGPFEVVDYGSSAMQWPQIEGSDLMILVVRLDQDIAEVGRRAASVFGRRKAPMMLVFTHADTEPVTRDLRNAAFRAFSFVSHLRTAFLDAREPAEVQAKLVPQIVESIPDLRTAVARQVPSARGYVADQVIAETCKVNAQFALAANLPANLPFLGSVAGTVADFFVLTKNQVMMVLRLAALYGRDVSPTLQVAAEVAPVIGGGFLWRTAARTVVGLLPTFVAAGPKMAIAYAGTYAAGHAARYYYDLGQAPSKQLVESLSAEGTRLFRGWMGRQ